MVSTANWLSETGGTTRYQQVRRSVSAGYFCNTLRRSRRRSPVGMNRRLVRMWSKSPERVKHGGEKSETQTRHEGLLVHLMLLGFALRGLHLRYLYYVSTVDYDVYELHSCILNGRVFARTILTDGPTIQLLPMHCDRRGCSSKMLGVGL